MKYLPAINLWDRGIQTAIINGQLKLQRGQWVKCGGGKLSRFVGVKPSGSLWVAHWQGNGKDTAKRFKTLCEVF